MMCLGGSHSTPDGPFPSTRWTLFQFWDVLSVALFGQFLPTASHSEATNTILEFCYFLSWFLVHFWLHFPGEFLNSAL